MPLKTGGSNETDRPRYAASFHLSVHSVNDDAAAPRERERERDENFTRESYVRANVPLKGTTLGEEERIKRRGDWISK